MVLGASLNPRRVSYEALARLQLAGEEVVAIGRKAGQVGTVDIQTAAVPVADVDTVTIYLSAKNQESYEEYLLEQIRPTRIIFNPGAENPKLAAAAKKLGIQPIYACTLVMLSTDQYQLAE